MQTHYDVIVLGSGSGGLTASIGLTKVGKKVLLIERSFVGGECTNSGCIPSKNLIHHARLFYEAKKWSQNSSALEKYKNNILKIVQSKIIEIRHEDDDALANMKIHLVKGRASFLDAHTIQVEKNQKIQTFNAQKIIIATGSSPLTIPIEGLNQKYLLTNENLFQLKQVPHKLLILGGGPIACEMAEAFAHLGTEVTMVIRGEHLLLHDEVEVSEEVEQQFERLGIQILRQAKIQKCKERLAIIALQQNDDLIQTEFDYLLMGLGRVPNLNHLNLEAARIKYNPRGIQVDSHYRTNQKHVFAIGDISSAWKFTHTADDQGRHVIKKILLPWTRATSNFIPRVTYLTTEVAAVGLSWKEILRQYGEESVLKLSLPWASLDRAKTDEEKNGRVLVFAKRITGEILGVSLTGRHAGEILNFFTLALQNRISLWKINQIIFPYPVRSLLIKKISDQFLAQTFTNLKPDFWFFLKKRLYLLLIILTCLSLILYFSKFHF